MTRTQMVLAASTFLGLAACGGQRTGSGPQGSTSGIGSSVSPGTQLDLGRCTQGLSPDTVDENLAIVFDLEQSYHEMVACGGLVGSMAGAVIEVVASLLDAPSGGLPAGFTREGSTYIAAPGGGSNTLMQAEFLYGDDYAVGARGEVVEHNVFAMRSYLENPRLDVDYTTGELLVRYDARGPLVELLGFGASPPRPLRLTPDDLGRLTRQIEKLRVQTTVEVDDARANSTVTYTLQSRPIAVGDVLDGQSFAFDVVTSAAAHVDLPQELDVQSWGVDYSDRVRGLDGDIAFAMVGGDFNYVGTFHYAQSTWPQTQLTCMD